MSCYQETAGCEPEHPGSVGACTSAGSSRSLGQNRALWAWAQLSSSGAGGEHTITDLLAPAAPREAALPRHPWVTAQALRPLSRNAVYSLPLRSPSGKESTCNAGDLGSIPRLGRSPGEGNGYPLQYAWRTPRTE